MNLKNQSIQDNQNSQQNQLSEESEIVELNENNKKNQQNGQQNQQHIQADGQKTLSKKKLRKLQKKQKWQQIKRQKRKQQRQKQKQKRKQKRQQLKQLQKKQQIQQHQQQQIILKQVEKLQHKKRKQQYKQKMLDGQKVVIDIQFFDLMTEKQKTSLGKQLAYCHSANRKSNKCFNFILTSVTEPRLQFFNHKYNVQNFGINILEQNIIDAFDKNKLVYLTGDAEEQLEQLNPNQIYIIGGIVDHNRLKNITINFARQKQIKARRLPMDGVKLKASVHLAVNHVWEWMLKFYNGSTWKQAIKSVIPQRKLKEPQIIQ